MTVTEDNDDAKISFPARQRTKTSSSVLNYASPCLQNKTESNIKLFMPFQEFCHAMNNLIVYELADHIDVKTNSYTEQWGKVLWKKKTEKWSSLASRLSK